MYKAAIVLALVAVASAGAPLAYAPYVDHHVGAQSEQTVRGFGGLSSVSHQQRQVNGAYSTSSAYKSKVTNNAVAYAAPAFAAPAYAAPAYAAPAYAAPIAHHAVAAPVAAYHAPAAVQYAAPYAHAVAPVARVAAPIARVAAAPAGLLGVAYSPVAPGIASLTFDGFGVHYGY